MCRVAVRWVEDLSRVLVCLAAMHRDRSVERWRARLADVGGRRIPAELQNR